MCPGPVALYTSFIIQEDLGTASEDDARIFAFVGKHLPEDTLWTCRGANRASVLVFHQDMESYMAKRTSLTGILARDPGHKAAFYLSGTLVHLEDDQQKLVASADGDSVEPFHQYVADAKQKVEAIKVVAVDAAETLLKQRVMVRAGLRLGMRFAPATRGTLLHIQLLQRGWVCVHLVASTILARPYQG